MFCRQLCYWLLERILTKVAAGLFVTTTCGTTIVELWYFCHKVMEILVISGELAIRQVILESFPAENGLQ